MAAYCWVYDEVSCRLTANRPRSALCPTLVSSMGPVYLYIHKMIVKNVICVSCWYTVRKRVKHISDRRTV